MNMLNQIILEGKVCKSELKQLPNGNKVLEFSIVTERSYMGADGLAKKEESFLDAVMYGKMAESAEPYMKENRGVRLVGRLKQDRWNESGKICSRVYVVAEHVDFKPVI